MQLLCCSFHLSSLLHITLAGITIVESVVKYLCMLAAEAGVKNMSYDKLCDKASLLQSDHHHKNKTDASNPDPPKRCRAASGSASVAQGDRSVKQPAKPRACPTTKKRK